LKQRKRIGQRNVFRSLLLLTFGLWSVVFFSGCSNPLGSGSSAQVGFLSAVLNPLLTDNSSSLFNAGTFVGTTWDATTGIVRLDQSGTPVNNSNLDSSWTPHWDKVVAYWPLDNSWTEVISNTAGTVTGTPAPALTTAGRVGAGAGNFTGTTNHCCASPLTGAQVSYGNLTSTNFGLADFTISAWIKTSTAKYMGLLTKNSQCGPSASLFRLEVTSGGVSYLSVQQDNLGTNTATVTSSKVVTDGAWHYIVATRSGAVLNMFVDGVLSGTTTGPGAANISSTALLSMGWDDCEQMDYNGLLDDVAVWSGVALSLSDVQSIYARQLATFSGNFQSRVMDGLALTNWLGLNWTTPLPFYKELPDYSAGAVQNETSSSYSSLVGDTAAVGDNNLMTGIVGLWHLDEIAGTTGVGSVLDRSGRGNHGTPNGSVVFGSAGKLGTSATFNGSGSQSINFGNSSSINFNGNITMAAWVFPTISNAYQVIIANSDGSGSGGNRNYALFLSTSGTGQVYVVIGGNAIGDVAVTPAWTVNAWNHVVMTADGVNVKIYINGILANTTPSTSVSVNTAGRLVYVGAENGHYPLNGKLDEVAVWQKALNAAEVQQLYRRGANRIKYQVRSCPDATCSTNPNWQGPDNTNQSYFSELNNNSVQSDSGDLSISDLVRIGAPQIAFPSFSPLAVSTNRYFQYRFIMESDDTGTGCNYGGGSTWCSPELQSVNIGH
jgi:hypothetical protein